MTKEQKILIITETDGYNVDLWPSEELYVARHRVATASDSLSIILPRYMEKSWEVKSISHGVSGFNSSDLPIITITVILEKDVTEYVSENDCSQDD